MKTICLTSLVLIFAFGCTKISPDETKLMERSNLLNSIELVKGLNAAALPIYNGNYFNEQNPYEIGGYGVTKSILIIEEKAFSSKSNPEDLFEDFLSILTNELPEHILNPDTSNPDTLESVIHTMVFDLLENSNTGEFIEKSKLIEEIIMGTTYFSETQRKRMLIYTSVLRNISGTMDYISVNHGSKGYSSEWEDCFISKLQDIFGCNRCYAEKLACVFTWPACLGYKAVDCVIEAIMD